jgi:hypothetical protein
MPTRDPHYQRAAEAAIRILTYHFDASRPRGELYFEILFVIKAAMYAVEEDRAQCRFTPSNN